MNWVTLTYRSLKLKHSIKFLLIFSICSLAVAGVVWACADYDDTPFSIFSPEAFVSKEYTPFFYDSYNWYYGTRVDVEDNNNRFNAQVVSEWDSYLNHQINQPALAYLLLKSSRAGTDSVSNYLNGKISTLKPGVPHISTGNLNKNQINNFFSYLRLAKECEKFAVSEDIGWYSDPKPRPPVSPILEGSLLTALTKSKEAFIKERLWFQLTRFYFFNDDTISDKKKPIDKQAPILTLFDKYKSTFPQNITYYRTLGYVAGYYRRRGDYAQANYLYSRCYDYSFEMKIPSKFSFHAQQEDDWLTTLKLAKNKEEQITLWHMLGMEYDPVRAIKEIAALNPKSDKMDLLLSRIINMREDGGFLNPYSSSQTDTTKGNLIALQEIKLVDSIALKNNTAKPYYWNIAAGYLNYIHNDYKKAGVFYAAAKKQLPVNDKLITAQYKLLNVLLDLTRIKRIDGKTEARLVEPLNWLADLRDGKEKVTDLRFDMAVRQCTHFIGNIYKKQGDVLKATCFDDTLGSYADSVQVQKLVNLFNNPKKSVYENTMLRYYHHTLPDLYYHQATLLTYKENIDKAIELMGKAKGLDTTVLLGNPFNIRINDCHDCDHEAPQKQKFTSLTFLKTIQSARAELKGGKNVYINAWLLANAYYNISFYGNARLFYQSEIIGHNDVDPGSNKYSFMEITTSQQVAEKYYLLARVNAQTSEQKARCTFMASKCERNEYYNQLYGKDASGYSYDPLAPPPAGKYFAELKNNYKQTKYYQEVLHECGYFKRYVNSGN